MSHGYTAEEMKFLTPDEIAALENDAGDDDGIIKDIAEGTDETKEAEVKAEPEGTAKPEVEAEKKPDAEQKADAKPGEDKSEPEAAEAPDISPAERTKPLYKADAEVADSKAKREELSTEKANALAKLLEGEITAAEYSAIDTRVQSEISKLDRAETKAETKAEVSAEMTQQQLMREWDREVTALAKQAKTEGIDYADEKLAKEFDTLVRVFGAEALANGMTDDNLAASKWALTQAHSTMKVRHGTASVTPATSAVAVQPEKKEEPRHALRTLGALPAADAQKVDNDPIARFATLEGEDLERALAKLPPDEIERMLAGT